jgi:hypothetical protein
MSEPPLLGDHSQQNKLFFGAIQSAIGFEDDGKTKNAMRAFAGLAADPNDLSGSYQERGRTMSGVEGDNIQQIKTNTSIMIDNQL